MGKENFDVVDDYPPVPEENKKNKSEDNSTEKKSIFARIRDFFKNIRKRIDDFFSSFQEDSDQNYSEQNETEQSGSGHDRYADEYDEEFFTAQDARRERRRDFIFAMTHPKYVQFETQNQGYSSKAQNNNQKNNSYESKKTTAGQGYRESSTSNNHGSENEKQNEQEPNEPVYSEQEQKEDNNINNNIKLPDGFTYSYDEKNGNTYIKKDNKDFMILNQSPFFFNEKKYIDMFFSDDLIKYVDQFHNSYGFQPTLKHSELGGNNIFVCHYENGNKDKYILDKVLTLADNAENIDGGGKAKENSFLYFLGKNICKIDKNAFSDFHDLKTIIIDPEFVFYPECRDAFIELFKNNKELDNVLVLNDEITQDNGEKIDKNFIENYCFENAIPNNNLKIFFKDDIEEQILEEVHKSDNQSKKEDIMNRFGLTEGENLNKFVNILDYNFISLNHNVDKDKKKDTTMVSQTAEERAEATAVAVQAQDEAMAAAAQAQAEAAAAVAQAKAEEEKKEIISAAINGTVEELGKESDTETHDLTEEQDDWDIG